MVAMDPWAENLIHLARHVSGATIKPSSALSACKFDPHAIQRTAQDLVGDHAEEVLVTGTFERRLVLIHQTGDRGWVAADLSGEPHGSRYWPEWARRRLIIAHRESWLSPVAVNDGALDRLCRPRLLLAALYHTEYFPLPRFSLAISDLARAARATLLGQVRLHDMQLGTTLPAIIDEIGRWQPDIVGISATFGQYDLMTELLDHLFELDLPPLVLAGGSLTARNEHLLADRYPRMLIARSAGEATIQDVLSYWHGDLDFANIRGIGYQRAPGPSMLVSPRYRRTAKVGNRTQTDIFPELDLLDRTFRHQGVAQLETSRGCTNYCSFCPRGHKGTWAGSRPEQLGWILEGMREVFDQYPTLPRILYLVDEEFIGRDTDAVPRARAVATAIHDAGFQWETSCRVDQIADPGRDPAWHCHRVTMWRELLQLGLRRCLFGVESGVTTILRRFNKETTGDQNAIAIRTLSALGVPTRFTYITFDHLMTLAELEATYAFQGRTDLILRPLPHLAPQELVAAVRDEEFVRQHATGRPFYHDISYMLVSMECLIGAAYTKQAKAAGLTRNVRPTLGRVDADFADWRIGLCSLYAQLWIDRTFALDYTLKSLEKRLIGSHYQTVRTARTVIKDAAYAILGTMLALVGGASADLASTGAFHAALGELLDAQIAVLRTQLSEVIRPLITTLPPEAGQVLDREYRRWSATTTWNLINAADPCGT